MSDIYLSRMKLRGFRSYTSETEVTFPAGPSMTVIVGPNGLGKSTLFDAIEWGLTGELRRLSGMEAKVSDRRAALGRKPEVQLWFSDEAHISRTDSHATIANVGTTSIADWLTADAWRGMSNIADCLQFTHFLGQSARQMFVHLDAKERWGLLEGPAGLQSLWKVQLALGRKQTQMAVDRVDEELAQTALQALEKMQRVGKLQADLVTMRELARAGDALAPAEILERCSRIDKDLANELGGNATPGHVGASVSVQELDGLLQRQKIDLETAERQLASQRAQLAPWVSSTEQYATALAKLADLGSARDIVAVALISDEAEAAELAKHVSARDEEWQATVDQCADIQKQRDAVVAESERLRQLVVLEERHQTLVARLGTLASQAAEQERVATVSREALALLELRRDRHVEMVERSSELAKLIMHAKALLKENSSRQNARVELVSLPEAEGLLLTELTALRLNLVAEETATNTLRHRKEAAAAFSNAITAGVAQIAAALREEDCACPVCRSTFAVKGKLKELAEQQARESNQQLVELETAILRQDEKIRAEQQKMDAVTGRLDRLHEKRLELNATITAADELENRLRSNALLAGLSLDAFLPTLSAAAAKTDEEIGSLASALTSSPDEASARAEIQRQINLRRETVKTHDECSAALAALAGELALIRSWPYTGRTVDELRGVLTGLDLLLVEAQQGGIVAQANLHHALAAAAVFAEHVAAKRSQLAQIDSQRELVSAAVSDLASRWSKQGYENVPSPDAVRSLDAIYENQQLRLERMAQEVEALVQGRQHYLAHSELQRLESDLQAQCGLHQATDVEALLASISRERNSAIRQRDLLASVEGRRKQLLARIKQQATDIRSVVSAPLNANIEKFCAALMSDRTQYVSLNAIANATSAQALLSFQPEDGSETAKNPLLYMSEGQLAATSMCLLFGASATYPWSRWKGLLMDDPLHHNDSIHAAAFIDVARNLIMHRGYQIIVSTHDMEQAGYFLRKCSNAGIPARYWHLYGRSQDGTALIQSA